MANYSDIFPLSTGGSSIAGFNWTEKTADFTAVANEAYYCDTALGNILMTLPSNPNPGDEVAFLLIGANAVKITTTDNIKSAPLATDYLKQVTENYLMVVLFYVDGTTGWDWDARYDSFINNAYVGDGDPYTANVVLLLKGDGANGSTNIVDSSLTPKTVSVYADAQISTAQSKYGGSSIYFDGVGDYLSVNQDVTDFNLPGDFTIETFIYLTAFSTNYSGLYGACLFATHFTGFVNGWQLRINGTASSYTTINIYTGTTDLNHSFNFNLNQWYHVAVSRNDNLLRSFVDGVEVASSVNSDPFSGNNTLRIGRLFDTGYVFPLTGYLDGSRITKGVARYTANFNPETDTFLNI